MERKENENKNHEHRHEDKVLNKITRASSLNTRRGRKESSKIWSERAGAIYLYHLKEAHVCNVFSLHFNRHTSLHTDQICLRSCKNQANGEVETDRQTDYVWNVSLKDGFLNLVFGNQMARQRKNQRIHPQVVRFEDDRNIITMMNKNKVTSFLLLFFFLVSSTDSCQSVLVSCMHFVGVSSFREFVKNRAYSVLSTLAFFSQWFLNATLSSLLFLYFFWFCFGHCWRLFLSSFYFVLFLNLCIIYSRVHVCVCVCCFCCTIYTTEQMFFPSTLLSLCMCVCVYLFKFNAMTREFSCVLSWCYVCSFFLFHSSFFISIFFDDDDSWFVCRVLFSTFYFVVAFFCHSMCSFMVFLFNILSYFSFTAVFVCVLLLLYCSHYSHSIRIRIRCGLIWFATVFCHHKSVGCFMHSFWFSSSVNHHTKMSSHWNRHTHARTNLHARAIINGLLRSFVVCRYLSIAYGRQAISLLIKSKSSM